MGRRCAPPKLPVPRIERGTNWTDDSAAGIRSALNARNGDHDGAQRRPTTDRSPSPLPATFATLPFDYVDFDVKLTNWQQKFYRVRQP